MNLYIPADVFWFSTGFAAGVVSLFVLAIILGKRRGV